MGYPLHPGAATRVHMEGLFGGQAAVQPMCTPTQASDMASLLMERSITQRQTTAFRKGTEPHSGVTELREQRHDWASGKTEASHHSGHSACGWPVGLSTREAASPKSLYILGKRSPKASWQQLQVYQLFWG